VVAAVAHQQNRAIIYVSPHARWLDVVARQVALPEDAFWNAIK
jgi:hypothetical protein